MDYLQNNKEAKLIALNGNSIRIDTPDWLRSFKGCEHYSDIEATTIINNLDTLATILLENAAKRIRHIDNQQVVSLDRQKITQKRAA